MKFSIICLMLFCLVKRAEAKCAEDASCCNDKKGSLKAPAEFPDAQSPAKGLNEHKNAAVCYFYRLSNCIVCRKENRIQKCCTQPPEEGDDTKFGGPTPFNEFLIGTRYKNETLGIDWHNLYPKKNDNSGYWGYEDKTENERSHMGLHPGTSSLGSVTVIDNICWGNLDLLISSGDMLYEGDGTRYDGFLYVNGKKQG